MRAMQANQRQDGVPLIKVPKQYELMNSLNTRHNDTKRTDFYERRPTLGPYPYEHDPTLTDKHLKADLIRRNLLSRKDLMFMYNIPQNKALLTINNTWVT